MNDPKIREHLKQLYLKQVDIPALIVDELGVLQGKSIVDIGVITPHSLEGFEIKSADDTLYRLPGQIESYNQVFDYLSIITEPKYIEKVSAMVPSFWGIIQTEDTPSGVTFVYNRLPTQNPYVDKRKVVELLWKSEVCAVLHELGDRGYSTLRREKLWDRLCEKVDLTQLKRHIYIMMKRRVNWKESVTK